MMFDQNAYNAPNNGQFQYTGMPNNAVKFNNYLTPEQIKRLQVKESQFSIGLTEEEQLRGICNHRNPDGTSDALIYDPITGTAKCSICGYEFRPVEPDIGLDVLKEDVARIVDVLQTIKLMYIDLPAEAGREYFQIIPLIEKIPQLFEFAAKNMNKHEAYNWQFNNHNMGAVAMFNNLTSLFGGMNAGGYQQQPMQPMMNPAYAQPAGFPQAAYGQPNAFGYPGASMPAYQPATPNGFAYQPSQAPAQVAPTVAAPAAPVAPAVPADTTVSQQITI